MATYAKKITLLALLLLNACFFSSPSPAWQAEELRKAGKYNEAIEQYQKHIELRLKEEETKKSNLNPYFYNLLIGDCYLETKNYEKAKKSYLFAKEKNVDKKLVGAKIRGLAQKLVENNKDEEAINLLQDNRGLDTLLFDIDINELHRKILESTAK